MTLLIISFIAGILTILAPCILPLLPVIIGRSLSDSTVSKRRVFVITLSLGASVIIFTLLLKATTLFIDIPQDFWKWFSGGIILIFGLVSLFPDLWENISLMGTISRKSNELLATGFKKDSVWGDVIVGASMGPIFSACSPTYFVILATVLPATPALGVLYLFVYALGLSLALLVVSLVGQKIMVKIGVAADPRGWFKRTMGVLFILVALLIISGYDKKIQVYLLDAGFFDVTQIELKLLGTDKSKQDTELPNQNFLSILEKKIKFTTAPDISSPDGFINTEGKPITISEFKGKRVVLLDIWTYSCINCVRTIPHLKELYEKYKDQGLVIIGLHTPEFAFEKVQKNVEDAVKKYGIQYPVVLDNDFSTWNAYGNSYWPRTYLIDLDGFIVYDHVGEGGEKETEEAIQKALLERNTRLGIEAKLQTTDSGVADKMVSDASQIRSHELYFGSARNTELENGKQGTAGTQTLTIPTDLKADQLYIGGTWSFTGEYAESGSQSSITLKYKAKNVYLVASSLSGENVEVFVDGKSIGTIFIKGEALYTIVSGTDYQEHRLEIKIQKSSVKAFAFTFG
ncbi:redoxin domain-containing protein [Patescibacteria group bacterium]|nr:redoxin domain-containing protein [Patescibacteria group bacterium]